MTTRKEIQRLLITAACALSLLAVSAIMSPVQGGEKGTASGELTLDGLSVRLGHAYALEQPNTFDTSKSDTAVLITEEPLPEGALKDIEDLLDAARDVKGSAWVFFKIDDTANPIFEMIYHATLGDNKLIMSGFTHAEFSKKVLTRNSIEGAFRTNKAENFVGHTYQLDVKFKAPVAEAKRPDLLPGASNGKELSADGGEPGKAYTAFHSALMKKDIETFRKFAPETVKGKNLSDKEIEEGMEFMALMSPPNPVIIKGFISITGERAVLYLTGIVENEKSYGTVEMIKSDGLWRVKKEIWSNSAPKE